MEQADYKVSFGKIARTILYEDRTGSVRFTFDVDASRGQEIIILERTRNALSSDDPQQHRLAFERTKQYLLSLGYQVEVFPAA